jgi:DNA-binding NarL/FixJ family response regulator
MTIRILIADDHGLIRAGLRALLEDVPEFSVVGEARDGLAVLEQTARLNPDVVLMDINMPGISGIEATRRLAEISPETRVLALTVHEEEGMLREMLRAGAYGYILKRAVETDLINAIQVVSSGYIYVYPSMTSALVKDLSPHADTKPISSETLTPREKDVLLLLAQGNTNRQIAQKLNLSPRTIEGHRSSLVSKLGISSRVELMKYVEEHELK